MRWRPVLVACAVCTRAISLQSGLESLSTMDSGNIVTSVEHEQAPASVAAQPDLSSVMRDVDRQVEANMRKQTGGDHIHVPGGLEDPFALSLLSLDATATPRDLDGPVTPLRSSRPAHEGELGEPGAAEKGESRGEAHEMRLQQVVTRAQSTLLRHLDTSRQTVNDAASLETLCKDKLKKLLTDTLHEKKSLLSWVGEQKTIGLKTLGSVSTKISKLISQIAEIQHMYDSSLEKKHGYALNREELLNQQKLHQVEVDQQLVQLGFFTKATDNLVDSLSKAIETKQAAVMKGREWYSSNRDALSAWLQDQELHLKVGLDQRKKEADTLEHQCQELNQVHAAATSRSQQYHTALEREKLQAESSYLKKDLFAQKQRFQEAAQELSRMKQAMELTQNKVSQSERLMQRYHIDAKSIATPPKSWSQTLGAAVSLKTSLASTTSLGVDRSAFDFVAPPPTELDANIAASLPPPRS